MSPVRSLSTNNKCLYVYEMPRGDVKIAASFNGYI